MAKDYYELLGVSKNATQDEIKKAFRKLAHEHHPDKASGNEAKFKEINEAYQTLGTEDKRRQYDQFGKSGAAGQGFNYQDFARGQGGNPFGGFSQGQGGSSFDFGNMGDMGDFGDLFSSFFGGSSNSRTKQATRGSDMEIDMSIEFEEAVFGTEKTINLQKKVVCETCGGNGAEPGSKVTTCLKCGGTGRIVKIQQTILGNFQTQATCPDCGGTGKKYEKKCHECHGEGVTTGSEKIKVTIPAGISDGQSLRLSGKGEAIAKGSAGDLFIVIKVKPSKIFKRDGDNIHSEIKISVKQAILGDKIEVETVDGPVSLKIPEGTQSHTEFRLREKGVPHLRSRGRGDHLVDVVVNIPRNLSRKQEKLLDELGI